MSNESCKTIVWEVEESNSILVMQMVKKLTPLELK